MEKLKYYTVQEVADTFRVSRQTVYNWVREGIITGSQASPRAKILFTEKNINDFRERIQTEN